MAKYSTRRLAQSFQQTLDHTLRNASIITNSDDLVTVNGIRISRSAAGWRYKNRVFRYKKSAVGYVLHTLARNKTGAEQILFLDRNVAKLEEDVAWYSTRLRTAGAAERKITLKNRISWDLPRLQALNEQLNQCLKSIKIA